MASLGHDVQVGSVLVGSVHFLQLVSLGGHGTGDQWAQEAVAITRRTRAARMTTSYPRNLRSVNRFQTTASRPAADRGASLRSVRLAAGIPIVEAARRLELPVLHYALLENGELSFEDPEAWGLAAAALRGDG